MTRPVLLLLVLCSCDVGHLHLSDSAGADGDEDGFGERVDCDDEDPAIHPDAEELCDGIDNDCDGEVDGDPVDGTLWYQDADGDGYGQPSSMLNACSQPSGYAQLGDDCDDDDAAVNPGAEDLCDDKDNDCDGETDEDALDSDGDGTPNCIDASVYSYDFDDGAWTGWDWLDMGGGNTPSWSMDSGVLGEISNSALSIAYGPDLGELVSYTVSVEGMSAGGMNNLVGLAFCYAGPSSYLAARWLDPNGYYGEFPMGGNVDLAVCSYGVCTALGADASGQPLVAGYSEWVGLSVTVDGGQAEVSWGGQVVVTAELPEAAGEGPQRIGVLTDDNDSGVVYDDIAVTVP